MASDTITGSKVGITIAVIIFLITSLLLLGGGVIFSKVAGLYVAMLGVSISWLTQVLWLRYTSRSAVQAVSLRDDLPVEAGA